MVTRYAFTEDQRERLAGIEATWDSGTRALLDSLGVRSGWRCLEAGAGGGSIAAWMAERVSPDGSVLATDVDTTFLEPLADDVLEVRRHDLTRDELPAESFDIVHARALLSWLGESDTLERLVGAVAPGGWLLIEDFDWALGGPAEEATTAAKAFGALVELIETSFGYDLHYGRTLRRRLERAGLRHVGSDGRAFVVPGGSPGTAFERLSLLAHRETLVRSGALTEPEIDELVDYLDDPARHVVTPVLFAAWGRRSG